MNAQQYRCLLGTDNNYDYGDDEDDDINNINNNNNLNNTNNNNTFNILGIYTYKKLTIPCLFGKDTSIESNLSSVVMY